MYFFRIFQIEQINQPIITQLKIKANINFSKKISLLIVKYITDIISNRLTLLFTYQMQ